MSGWFAVKRGILDHDLFMPNGKWSKAEAWIWMVENAAFKDTTVNIGGKPHQVQRGDLCFSERFMAEKFHWSQKALRTFLDKLEAHGAIMQSVAKTGQGTRSKRKQITLCNYDKYQHPEIKTEAKQKQNGSKEEQVTINNIPTTSVNADAPTPKVVEVDPVNRAVWDLGVPMLAECGANRSVIGKWLKGRDAIEVLSAIRDAQKAGTKDPVSYITKILSGKKPARHWSGVIPREPGMSVEFENTLRGYGM